MDKFFMKLEKYEVKVYDFSEVELGEMIGWGGFGEVYKGKVREKTRALKRLFFEMNELQGFLSDLLRELVYSKELTSKRFTRIYGISYDKENNEIYVIMELLTCEDLSVYLKKKNLTRNEKREIFDSIVLALRELQSLNYIHCDLKPENLCYYNDYKRGEKYIKILDYNLLKKLPSNKQVTDGYNGTYGYSAPEQYKNEICLKSDNYAIGVIYLEMLLEEDIWGDNFNNYQKCRKIVLEKLDLVKEDEDYSIIKGLLSSGYNRRFSLNSLKQQ